jgi:hypothetical protein
MQDPFFYVPRVVSVAVDDSDDGVDVELMNI